MNQLKGLKRGQEDFEWLNPILKEEGSKDHLFSYEDYLMNELVKSLHTGSFGEDPRGLRLPPLSERDYGPSMVQYPYSWYKQNEDFYRDPYKRRMTERFNRYMSGFQKGEPSYEDISEQLIRRSQPHEVYPPQWSDPLMQAARDRTPQEIKEIEDVMGMLRAGHKLTGESPDKR